MTLLLGIDLGTSYFKVGLFDARGELKGLGREPVPKETPAAGRSELAVERFWQALRAALKTALAQAGANVDAIGGVSYSSQASSFLLLDAHAVPLTPIVMWTDTRAEPVDEGLSAFAALPEFQQRVGFFGLSAFAAPTKWHWFQQHAAETWAAAARIMTISDYFSFALTGERVGDASTAAFLGIYDLAKADWWPEALRRFAIDPAKLSMPLRPGSAAGKTTDSAHAHLGLRPGIPFAVGAIDHHAAAIGSGLGVLADVSISTGTVLAALTLAERVQPVAGCYHGPHVDARRFYRLTFDPDGAGRLEDYQRKHAPQRSLEELLALAATAPAGSPTDELRGRPLTDAEHAVTVRWILERVSLTHRRLVDEALAGARASAVVATGGGTRSALWLQITADTLGVPVVTSECPERACLGAAMFASVAAGMHPTLAVAGQVMVRRGAVYSPKVATRP